MTCSRRRIGVWRQRPVHQLPSRAPGGDAVPWGVRHGHSPGTVGAAGTRHCCADGAPSLRLQIAFQLAAFAVLLWLHQPDRPAGRVVRDLSWRPTHVPGSSLEFVRASGTVWLVDIAHGGFCCPRPADPGRSAVARIPGTGLPIRRGASAIRRVRVPRPHRPEPRRSPAGRSRCQPVRLTHRGCPTHPGQPPGYPYYPGSAPPGCHVQAAATAARGSPSACRCFARTGGVLRDQPGRQQPSRTAASSDAPREATAALLGGQPGGSAALLAQSFGGRRSPDLASAIPLCCEGLGLGLMIDRRSPRFGSPSDSAPASARRCTPSSHGDGAAR